MLHHASCCINCRLSLFLYSSNIPWETTRIPTSQLSCAGTRSTKASVSSDKQVVDGTLSGRSRASWSLRHKIRDGRYGSNPIRCPIFHSLTFMLTVSSFLNVFWLLTQEQLKSSKQKKTSRLVSSRPHSFPNG